MTDKPVTTANEFICDDCAVEFCNYAPGDGLTWHEGQCCVCDKIKPVTQVRDFDGIK